MTLREKIFYRLAAWFLEQARKIHYHRARKLYPGVYDE